jgi:hypothetical protein
VCFFHLVNNEGSPGPGELDYDPCARYQSLADHAERVFRHHYTPHQEISVDKSLVGTKTKPVLCSICPTSGTTIGESDFGCYMTIYPTTAWDF